MTSSHWPPSPLQLITHPVAKAARIRWYVKRDDLHAPAPGHPFQGNKIRKLSGLLAYVLPGKTLITFGGAFSNHLAATAAAGQIYGHPTIGIVRGEEVNNPILAYCRSAGMQLHFVTREKYRLKNQAKARADYLRRFGPGHLIPEGGSGEHAFVGTRKILPEVIDQLGYEPDFFQLSAGTGGTAAGVISATKSTKIEVFPALKGNWMADEILQQLEKAHMALPYPNSWIVIGDYHFGGYAKQTVVLQDFMVAFTHFTGIPLERIYTAKLFYGVIDRIKMGVYPEGTTLVTYHSGGVLSI